MAKESVPEKYFKVLLANVAAPDEKYLLSAAELGRELVMAEIPPEEIAGMHEEALARLAEEAPDTNLVESVRTVSAPLMALLVAYGLAFREKVEALRLAEEKLKAAKEFSENLLETADMIVVTLNPEAGIITFNRYAEELTGYAKEEVIGKNWFDIFVPQRDRETISNVFKDVLKNLPEVSQYENPIVTKSGDERVISWSNNILRDTSGNINGVLSIGMDITKRKRAEEALRAERDNLHNMFESIEDGIYIVDQQYDIQYVNPVLIKDFGPYEGRKCYEYFRDRDEVCPWCKNHDVWAGKTVRWEWYSPRMEGLMTLSVRH